MLVEWFLLNEDGTQLLNEDGTSILLDVRILSTFPVPEPTFESVLRGHHDPISKIELLSADLNTIEATLDGQLFSGNVNTDRHSDTGGSASAEVVNDDGTLDMVGIGSLIWPDRLARISRGAMVGNTPRYEPQITGPIALPEDAAKSGKIAFTVNTRLAIAKRNFPQPTTIDAGGRGEDAIRELLELGGLGTSDAWFNLYDGGFIVPVARTFGTNEEILGAVVKWAFDMGCDLWPDGVGVIWMRPFVDPLTVTPTWDFTVGRSTILAPGVQRKLGTRQQVNHVIVYGRYLDGSGISAEAKVTRPGDPLFWRPGFDLPFEYKSPDIADTPTLLAIARQLLADFGALEESREAGSVPIPLVSARKVVRFAGAQNDLLDSVSMPIWHGAMRMSSRRARSVFAS